MQQTCPSPSATIKALLKCCGRTFAEDLGINAEANEPSPLFCLLVSAMLFSTRISHNVAMRTARVLFDRGWTSPEKMAATSWAQRVEALDEGGYARYDERTSTMLGEMAELLVNTWQGDLRRLREAAGCDPAQERRLLDQFKGIGEVAVDIFFREAQLAWPELYPFADARTLACAKTLGLPADAKELAALAHGRRRFVRMVAALVRVGLEHKHDEILQAAC